MSPLPEILLTLGLAFCLSSLGNLLLRRRPKDLFEWNLSFLTGLSLAAGLLFPLTLLTPTHALAVTLGMLLLAVARHPPQLSLPPKDLAARVRKFAADRVSAVLGVMVMLLAVQFAVENQRLTYLWDGFQIWATKALVLYQRGGLTQDFLLPGERDRLAEYPPLLPMYQALIPLVRGEFDWNALKPVFLVFYLSLLVSTYHAARALAPRRLSLGATALLALLPAVSTRFSVGGYADMPQAAFVAGSVAALLALRSEHDAPSFRTPAPWILGGLVLVKNEGVLLLVIAVAIVALMFRTKVFACRGAVAVTAGFLIVRRLYVAWVDARDLTYGPLDAQHLERAAGLLLTVPRLCAREMLQFEEWGLFWPVFFAAAAILWVSGAREERYLAGGAVLAIMGYSSIFYLTNWDVELHIRQAYSRLLVQVAPLGAISIAAACARLLAGGTRQACHPPNHSAKPTASCAET